MGVREYSEPPSPPDADSKCLLRREEFVQWVELLPDAQTPSWLGLPNNAEKVLLTTQGEY